MFYGEEKGALFKRILFEVVKRSWQVTVSWSNKLIIVTLNVASLVWDSVLIMEPYSNCASNVKQNICFFNYYFSCVAHKFAPFKQTL